MRFFKRKHVVNIANRYNQPRGGKRQSRQKRSRLAELVIKLLGDPEFWYTEAPSDGAGLAGKAVKDGFGTVVALGGDGTLNEV